MSENEKIRIRQGWAEAGKEGVLLGEVYDLKNQRWAVVQWNGDDGPDLFKFSGLEKEIKSWRVMYENRSGI